MSRFGQGVLEPGGVKLASLQAQPVAPLQSDQVAACRAEGAAQAGNLRPQRRTRVSGQPRPPQLVDQPVSGNHLVSTHEQYRQRHPLLGAGERNGAAVHPHLDRAEQPVPPHGHRDLLRPAFSITHARPSRDTVLTR